VASLPEKFEGAQAFIRMNGGTNATVTSYYSGGKLRTSIGSLGTASVDEIEDTALRVMDLYPDSFWGSRKNLLRTFWHETGHHIAQLLWNDFMPAREWMHAVALDGNFVTAYSQMNFKEDFAETVEEYIATDGGRLNPIMRARHSHRFDFLDALMARDVPHSTSIAARVRTWLAQALSAKGIHLAVPETTEAKGYMLYLDGDQSQK
jgi:hypothetical protein